MKSSDYWRKRFIELEKATHQQDKQFIQRLVEVFTNCAEKLDLSIYKFFKRFAEMESISIKEANRLLNSEELKAFKMTVEEYIKLGERQNIKYSPETNKVLEEASLKYRVTRLEAVSYEMAAIVGHAMGSEQALLYDYLARRYQDRYYRTVFTVFKNYGVGVSFAQVDRKTVNKLLDTPWAVDGTTFSDRIWNHQTKLVNTLRNVLTDACIRGSGYMETSERLAKEMNTTLTNASRLVTTESAFFSTEAQMDSFKELGSEEYEFVATLDETTDEECGQLDGKVFKMSDYAPGVNAPPIHVNCRCTLCPHFDDSDVPGYVEGSRTARNKGGKTYRIPRNMKYSEWKKKYIDNETE